MTVDTDPVKFGEELQRVRRTTRDKTNSGKTKALSGPRFAEELQKMLDMGNYPSPALVGQWEKGKSLPQATARKVILYIIRVLSDHDGIKSVDEANYLLGLGGYRHLDVDESYLVFGSVDDPIYVGRDTDTIAVKNLLDLDSRHAMQRRVIIRGWPGVGKSAFVARLRRDKAIIVAYPDGVFLIPLGSWPYITTALKDFGLKLGLHNLPDGLDDILLRIKTALVNKKLLLILDDVYDQDHAKPFLRILGDRCDVILTTRFAAIAYGLMRTPSDIYILKVLDSKYGLELLQLLTPKVVSQHGDKSLRLVADLEGLPLAIRVAGRVLEQERNSGGNISELFRILRESHILLDDLAPDDRFDPISMTTPTVKRLFEYTAERLDEASRWHFALLSRIAPKPAYFENVHMAGVWDVPDPQPSIRILIDYGLLEYTPDIESYQMHALLVKYAESLLNKLKNEGLSA